VKLTELKERHPLVGDVRGIGLLLGVELVTDRDARTPACEAAEDVLYRALGQGLSFKVSMGNVLTLMPPLTVSEEELERAFSILDRSLEGCVS
jgi:4-aminobutyrate aminotransferase